MVEQDARHPIARHACNPQELQHLNAARRTGAPLLAWRDEQGALETLVLEDGARYELGRRPTMAVPIAWDAAVSRLHAELVSAGGEWVLADPGFSRNGTYLNGARVPERARLRDGDVLRVGRTLLAFEAGHGAGELADTEVDARDGLPQIRDVMDRAILRALCREYVVHGRPIAVDNEEIAAEVCQSVNTVKARLRALFRSAGISLGRNHNRAELMRRVVDHGLISARDYR
jgi:hypothetical protein